MSESIRTCIPYGLECLNWDLFRCMSRCARCKEFCLSWGVWWIQENVLQSNWAQHHLHTVSRFIKQPTNNDLKGRRGSGNLFSSFLMSATYLWQGYEKISEYHFGRDSCWLIFSHGQEQKYEDKWSKNQYYILSLVWNASGSSVGLTVLSKPINRGF